MKYYVLSFCLSLIAILYFDSTYLWVESVRTINTINHAELFQLFLLPAFRPFGLRNEQRRKNTKKLKSENGKVKIGKFFRSILALNGGLKSRGRFYSIFAINFRINDIDITFRIL
jgi:hypothetical protein